MTPQLALIFIYVFMVCVDCLQNLQYMPRQTKYPQLILISGATGTGKSTFGMTLALNKGILKCISTDTLRQVRRTCDQSPALHRSSYEGDGDPVKNWYECCEVLQGSINGMVNDCIRRGVSLVMEGVHVVPSKQILDHWVQSGGVAIGVVLSIEDEILHKNLIYGRGEITKKGATGQIKDFSRIRAIQGEMIRLGKHENWQIIHENMEKSPYEVINSIIDYNNPSMPCKIHPLTL